MTCHVGGNVVICRPTRAIKRLLLACPQCKEGRVRAVSYDEGYYGSRTMLACGHSWADGEWWPNYQGPVHRKETRETVAEVWRAKLPPYREQLKTLMHAMGLDT